MFLNRRQFIVASAVASLTRPWSGCPRSRANAAAGAIDALDYTTPEAFDYYDNAWNDGNGNADKNNENGALGWGEGWVLQAYVVMYQAHRDTRYLDKVISQFDQVLTQRDNVRGVTDWRGKSLPSWRSVGDYTCGELVLKTAAGAPALRLRCGARPAERVSIELRHGNAPELFDLIATYTPTGKKSAQPIVDRYENLSMDAGSTDFAVKRINDAFGEINTGPGGARVMLTADDGRTDATDPTPPAPLAGTAMVAMPYIFAVQVGHLTTPIATFIRLVHETPELRGNSKYATKADEYLDALHQAVDVHDYEWQENDAGEGWLQWNKGSPNIFDGCDHPHNQYLSLGRTMIQLAAVTTDPVRKATYIDRARKMATTFKNDLQLSDDEETVRWTYFWSKGVPYNGWTEEDDVSEAQPTLVWPKPGGIKMVEDTSHAVLDVDFARLAFENNLGVFNERDMKRFARTFVSKMLTKGNDGEPTVFTNVDGTGNKGPSDNAAAAWIMLAEYEPTIYDAMLRNFQTRRPNPGPPAIPLGIAYMNWYNKRHLTR